LKKYLEALLEKVHNWDTCGRKNFKLARNFLVVTLGIGHNLRDRLTGQMDSSLSEPTRKLNQNIYEVDRDMNISLA
jgi:hypothetical protein